MNLPKKREEALIFSRANLGITLALVFSTLFVLPPSRALANKINGHACPTEPGAFFDSILVDQNIAPQPLPPEASLAQIKAAHKRLLAASPGENNRNIEARRIVDQHDWPKALAKHPSEPWKYYGENTMNDWFEAVKFVNRNADDAAISGSLLKKIHNIAAKSHKFNGFEGRRIRDALRRGEITEAETQTLLHKAFREKVPVSGVDHSTLVGEYRKEAIDQVEHHGSSFLPDGTRYFTKEEIDAIRKNPFMTVKEDTVRQIGLNKFTGTTFYHDVNLVESATEEVIAKANAALARATTDREVIEAAFELQKDLISIHPFLDGNGRSIRLLVDLILKRHGLPPSLFPLTEELTTTAAEAYTQMSEGMRLYVNEHIAHQK